MNCHCCVVVTDYVLEIVIYEILLIFISNFEEEIVISILTLQATRDGVWSVLRATTGLGGEQNI